MPVERITKKQALRAARAKLPILGERKLQEQRRIVRRGLPSRRVCRADGYRGPHRGARRQVDKGENMKVFTNDTDTVIAGSLEAVQSIVEAHYGATFEQEGWSIDEWREVDADKTITIHNAHGNGYDDVETKTGREWANQEGPSFLCSTEW